MARSLIPPATDALSSMVSSFRNSMPAGASSSAPIKAARFTSGLSWLGLAPKIPDCLPALPRRHVRAEKVPEQDGFREVVHFIAVFPIHPHIFDANITPIVGLLHRA